VTEVSGSAGFVEDGVGDWCPVAGLSSFVGDSARDVEVASSAAIGELGAGSVGAVRDTLYRIVPEAKATTKTIASIMEKRLSMS
jgi:hypothetical protein